MKQERFSHSLRELIDQLGILGNCQIEGGWFRLLQLGTRNIRNLFIRTLLLVEDFSKFVITRKHSNGMHTAHLCFSFNGHHQMLLLGSPKMKKFERVSSDHHQMPPARGPRSDVQRVRGTTIPFWGGYPTMWPIPWCMLPTLLDKSLVNRQTPVNSENSTFPQLRLRTAKTGWELSPCK